MKIDTLYISRLSEGLPGITPVYGSFLAEAVSVCLEEEAHRPGVLMRVRGDFSHYLRLVWENHGDNEQRERSWGDADTATENGAYGIAALLIDELTAYTVVERARKGRGFDYWLGKKGTGGILFQDAIPMEVSGIRKGDRLTVGAGVRQKVDQVASSGGLRPSVVIVVEFSSPQSRVKVT